MDIRDTDEVTEVSETGKLVPSVSVIVTAEYPDLPAAVIVTSVIFSVFEGDAAPLRPEAPTSMQPVVNSVATAAFSILMI